MFLKPNQVPQNGASMCQRIFPIYLVSNLGTAKLSLPHGAYVFRLLVQTLSNRGTANDLINAGGLNKFQVSEGSV